MIAVFVTFEFAAMFDAERIRQVADEARGRFGGMPGLRLKAFTLDEANRRATNVYLWESEAAARAFFTPELVHRIAGRYGTPPRIVFAEVVALVENGAPAG